ncbi:MAG: hypothetical protein C0391_04350 [Anaerolinea sp.]|nr:hypothetical protein [Anaerolinea sp.]
MLNEKDIRGLLTYTSGEPVLSLYLNTEPSGGNADAYRLNMRSMLKGVDAIADVQRIEQYFNQEYDWSGRSVAVFSCAAEDYFRAFPLAVPVRSLVRLSKQLHIKPLADLWDAYGGYGVALVDKQGARVFYFNMGSLEEQEGFLGEAVKHVKKGGASSFPGRRGGTAGRTGYEDELESRNMKEAAAFAGRFFESNHVRRVLIGGTEENIASFKNHLPKIWQSLVVGTFHSPITASHTEVQAKAYQIGEEAERVREAGLVEAAITAAAKGGAGASGMEETLQAVSAHRVQTLLVKEGYYASGAKCPRCGLLTAVTQEACPVCGSAMGRVLDVVDSAVIAVLQTGGDVEIVHENQALEAAGKIAALLRF